MRLELEHVSILIAAGVIISLLAGMSLVAEPGQKALAAASANDLALAMGLTSADIVSANLGTSDQAGVVVLTTPAAGFPTQGNSYAVLSSGCATNALAGGQGFFTSCGLGGLNTNAGTDRVTLSLVMNVPEGASTISFDWRFFSEEYPEYVGSAFNDGFLAEKGSSTFTISGTTINAPNNVAFDQNGKLITINTVGALGMTAANAAGTVYDGGTPKLTTTTSIPAGATQVTLHFSVFDVGDNVFDTAVFLDNLKFDVGGGGSTKKTSSLVCSSPAIAPEGDTIEVSATLKDATTLSPISGADIQFSVLPGGPTSTAITGTNGIASASLSLAGLSPGSYTVKAFYAGGTIFQQTSCEKPLTIEVAKTPTEIANLAVRFDSSGRYFVTGELHNSNTQEGIKDQQISITFNDGTASKLVNTGGVRFYDLQGIGEGSCSIGPANPGCTPDGGVADPDGDGVNVFLNVHANAEIQYHGYAATVTFLGNSGDVILCREACGAPADEFLVPTSSDGPVSVTIGSSTNGPHTIIVKEIRSGPTASISDITVLGSNIDIKYLDANLELASSRQVLQTDEGGNPTDILANGGAFYVEDLPAQSTGSLAATATFVETDQFIGSAADTEPAAYVASLAGGSFTAGTGYADGNCSTTLISGANCYQLVTGYTTGCDRDGDALCDSWETGGIPYTWSGGSAVYNLCLPDGSCPNPDHKDLYVEEDFAPNHGISLTARNNVIAAFAAIPNAYFKVANPDGLDGVTLHWVQDEQYARHYTMTEVWKDSTADSLLDDHQDNKRTHFGTLAERNAAIAAGGDKLAKMRGAKATAYTHVQSVHGLKTGTAETCTGATPAGQAEVGGNDIMIGLGCGTTPGGTVTTWSGTTSSSGFPETRPSVHQEKVVVMHELGHKLGLDHGGPRFDMGSGTPVPSSDYLMGCKLNYPSIMSYSRLFNTYFNIATPVATHMMEFSGGNSNLKYTPVSEAVLSEASGTTKPAGAPSRALLWKDTISGVVRSGVPNAANDLDYNGNGLFTNTFTTDTSDGFPTMDPNNFGIGTCGASLGQTQLSGNDVYSFDFDHRNGNIYADAAPVPLLEELTVGTIQEITQDATDAGIDVTAPGFTSMSATGNTPDAASTFVEFSAQAEDPSTGSDGAALISTGVNSVKVKLVGPQHRPTPDQLTIIVDLVQSGGTYSNTHNFGSEPDGVYSIYFMANDLAVNAAGDPLPNSVEWLHGTLLLDRTAPIVSGTPDDTGATPNAAGWYNVAPKVNWDCQDLPPAGDPDAPTSGLASCDPLATYSGPDSGTASMIGHGTDNAGNEGTGTFGFKYDATKPDVSITGISSGQTFYYGESIPTPGCSASDAVSGLDGPCTVASIPNDSNVGTHTVKATAKDNAGNEQIAEITYTILPWTLKGFYHPVDMNGVVNMINGGQSVPMKFEVFVNNAERTDATIGGTTIKSFTQLKISCSTLTGEPSDAVEVTNTGTTSLRYDGSAGQFIANWKTPKQPGTCWEVKVVTKDGSSLAALFKLK